MIALCLGMQSSASTWAYNIARGILAEAGVPHAAFQGETMGDFAISATPPYQDWVVKAHQLQGGMMALLQAASPRAILSIRDPRDAITSLMQRFGAHFAPSVIEINRSMASVLTAAQYLSGLHLVYEDMFSDEARTVTRIAETLGCILPAARLEALFDRNRPAAVKAIMKSLETADTAVAGDNGDAWDAETHYHRTHISDMRVGKWASVLTPAEAALADASMRGYENIQNRFRRSDGRPVDLSGCDFSIRADCAVFSPIDSIDSYTHHLEPGECRGPLGYKVIDRFHLPAGKWRMALKLYGMRPSEIFVCHLGKVIFRTQDADPETFTYANAVPEFPMDVHCRYDAPLDEWPDTSLTASFCEPLGVTEGHME